MLRYIFTMGILFGGLLSFSTWVVSAEERYFVVTAYYSPLPDQEYYLKGNYEAEIRLNGRWIAGASGKWVFPWMLAAPKNYAFGTKIYLEWLGIWSVQDRWGAIVNAGNRGYQNDRIDVWMGYGDEWLKRALSWWKRTVKWDFAPIHSPTTIDINSVAILGSALSWAQKNVALVPEVEIKKLTVFDTPLTTPESKQAFQKIVTELGLYESDQDLTDKTMIDIIYEYQVAQWLLNSPYSSWAGYFWPKTRALLKNDYERYIEDQQRKEEEDALLASLQKTSLEQAQETVDAFGTPKFWEVSSQVRALQKQLSELGYFDHKDTAIFGNVTKDSIIHYQLERNIITSTDQQWAWVFGPKTQEQLQNDIAEKIFIVLLSEQPELAHIEIKNI